MKSMEFYKFGYAFLATDRPPRDLKDAKRRFKLSSRRHDLS